MFHRSKLKSSLQLGPLDCGPANLRALCLNAGVRVDNERVRSLCDTTRAGSSLFRLHDAAETLGFSARLRSLDLYDLRDHDRTYLPVIVALRTGGPLHHFVTIHAFRRNRVVVVDPAFGLREMDFDEVRARMVPSELPYRTHDVRSEEQSQENRDELLEKLRAHGVPAPQASTWLERHSLFYIDDCLKYVEVIEGARGGRALGPPRDVLAALLETETFELPDRFGTRVRYDAEKSVAVVTGPVVLEVKGRPSAEFLSTDGAGPKRRLLSLLWMHRRAWAPQGMLAACQALLGLALAASTGLLVRSLDTGWPPFAVLAIALGCAQLVSDYARYALARGIGRLNNALVLRAKSGLLESLSRAPERRLRDRTTGELVARVEESSSLASFLTEWGIGTAVSAGTVAVAVAMVVATFWPFLVIAAVQVAVAAAIVELFSRRLRRLARDVYDRATAYNSRLLEILRGLEAVRLVRAGNHVFYEADHLASRLTQSAFRQQDWMILQQIALSFASVAAMMAMVGSGYAALRDGTATPAAITSALALTAFVQGSLSTLLRRRQVLEGTGVALERYEELSVPTSGASPSADAGSPGAMPDWTAIDLQGVSFGYRRDRPVLRDVTLSMRRGETICLLGSSGAGKSTLFDVLIGMYPVDAGRIRVDGRDASPGDLARLGSCLVQQEPILIHGTLLENVCFERAVPDAAALAAAGRAAAVEGLIERLPEGWQTRVGGRWSGLSGGEKRRICLCRALVHEPVLLLLDETLGALEPVLRRTIFEKLRAWDTRMTIVMVSHDPSDAAMCDRTIVMSGGAVVEDGPSAELLRSEGSRLRRLSRGRGGDE